MAGAKRPDGKAAKTERVTFTRPAAERIARVVRSVESGDRGAEGLTFTPRMFGGGKVFRVCTFTGSWAIGDTKAVTFKNQTTTPNTVTAKNLFFPITETWATSDCAIAKDATAWYLVSVPLMTTTAVFASGTATQGVLSSITISASLNTSDCTISVTQTPTTNIITVITSTFTAPFLQLNLASVS